ncbi:MAG TPA: OmpA family protein [Polyangiaceae bacterium]|nr:OmpA family protein [Polyangiaceae bacterium]
MSRPARAVLLSVALAVMPFFVAGTSGAQSTTPPLQVEIDKSKVDLKEHHLELRASHDLTKVTIKVTGDSGNVLDNQSLDLGPQPANTPLVLRWSPIDEEPVAKIEVSAYDAAGSWRTITITPWSIAIPHEEVNFRTDSFQIDDPEKPKLEASFVKVTEALAKHPEIHVTLFIAGHTDTVGDASYNMRLSRQRAQSIARWFRTRGLKIPIAFEGFGESALLVKTADEVDEPRNRRVDYILSVEEPVFKTSGRRPSWARIP